MLTLDGYIAIQPPEFRAAVTRELVRMRRYPPHIPARRAIPGRGGRWRCMACGLKLPKRNLDALCRYQRNYFRREDAGQ